MTVFKILSLMTEKQLVELNEKLCQQFEADLIKERLSHKNHIVVDTGEGKRKKGLIFGQPWFGPSLKRKPGHYRFDDKDQDGLKNLKRRATLSPEQLHKATGSL